MKIMPRRVVPPCPLPTVPACSPFRLSLSLSRVLSRFLSGSLSHPLSRPLSLSLLLTLTLTSTASLASGVAVQVTDGTGQPLADAILFVGAAAGAALPGPAHSGAGKTASVEQRGLKFMPLVSVVQTGTKISFPNTDRVKHHIYSFSPAKKFDQKLYSGVAAAPQIFDKVGTVVLGCNIHDRMVAYIKVVDTPYFARTDGAGVARIELPFAGYVTVSAWHYNMLGATAEQSIQVKAGDTPTTLTFKLATKPAAADPGP